MSILISKLENVNEEKQQRSPRSLQILIIEDVADDAELTILVLESADISFTYDITSTVIECQRFLQEKKK